MADASDDANAEQPGATDRGTAPATGGGLRHRTRTALMAAAPLLLGVVLTAAVCYPFIGGRLLLLDFVSGPHQPLLPPAAFGLNGGLTGGVPLAVIFRLLDRVLGQAGTVVPAAVFFPLATTGAARLVRTAALPGRLGAGLLYAANPFVLDRLYAGQLGVLLGYALLPFAASALLETAREPHRIGRAACWAAAAVLMTNHLAWILLPVALAIALTCTSRPPAVLRLGAAALGAAVISAYLLVPPLLVSVRPSAPLGQLNAYQTHGDPRVGLLVNVAGLYGFFRPGPAEPKAYFAGWPAVLAALLVIVAAGYAAVLRDAGRRREGLAILAAGIAGYFLALGSQGPTGGLFRLAYEHVPGFVMMREPDKFAMLLALAYAYGFGWGIAWLTARGRRLAGRLAPAVLAIALPLAYTPTLPGGLAGQVTASTVPASWSAASRLAGRQTVLFLPWHEYLATPFTGQRAVANPAAYYFAGPVLTGQNPGAGYAFSAEDPEHVVLDRLLGPPAEAGRARAVLAGLGVRFIALAKVADWRTFAPVTNAPGIRRVYSSRTLDLFAVLPTAQEIRNGRRLRLIAPAAYQIMPGRPGIVPLPVAYAPGWTIDGRPAIRLSDGQAGVLAPARGGIARYGPSAGIIASELGSLVALIAVAILALCERRRRLAHRSDRDRGDA